MQKVNLLKDLQQNKKYFVTIPTKGQTVDKSVNPNQKNFEKFFNNNSSKKLPDAPGGIGL